MLSDRYSLCTILSVASRDLPVMLSTTKKHHHTCFECRVTFKGAVLDSVTAEPDGSLKCPNCKKPTVRLGNYFKAPRRNATQQWMKVELLYVFGERFDRRNSGLGLNCVTLASTKNFLVSQGNSEADVDATLKRIREVRLTGRVP